MKKVDSDSSPANLALFDSKSAALFDFAPCSYLILSKAGKIIDVNPCAAGMLGRARTALIDLDFHLLIGDDTRLHFDSALEKAWGSKTRLTCDVMLSSGSQSPLYVNLSGITTPDGTQFLVTMVDIFKYKQAEEVLLESKKFLKETQLIAALGTYSLDIKSGTWTSCEILESIFGIDAAFDKTYENWLTVLHPEWRRMMNEYFTGEVLGKKIQFDKEYKIVRVNDQAERWVHGIGNLKLDENGQSITMVGTIRDVTEHKIMEEAMKDSVSSLDASLESTADGILIVSTAGKITKWNQKFIDMWQMSEKVLSRQR